MSISDHWRIWIDTGGTFTDCIATSPAGNTTRIKVLSTSCLRGKIYDKISPKLFQFQHKWLIPKGKFNGFDFRLLNEQQNDCKVVNIDWQKRTIQLTEDLLFEHEVDFEITSNEEAPVLAARLATQTALNEELPPIDMRLGFTKGTNALLERKGAKVTLLVTKGFKDLLLIGTQQRPHLFQLNIPDAEKIYDQIIEVEERVDARGEIIIPVQNLEEVVSKVRNEVIAIALMHSYKNPVHEQQLKEALSVAGKSSISLSSEISPVIKILPRTQTTLINAYLLPVLQDYLFNIAKKLPGGRLNIMTSAGGLTNAALFHPKDSLLSGPAGGVVGAARIAKSHGFQKVLTLDMGGTSTDTARFSKKYDYRFTTEIDGIELSIPSLSIETVAAGGGSICYFQDGRLQVGPQSAGAKPGPACYGAGGPLTITDVNLLLGKLDPSAMGIPIHMAAAKKALLDLKNEIQEHTQQDYTPIELLKGFELIANQKMAAAIRKISVAKGFDPKEYALLAFGGAGGLHACQIAERLEIDKVILPYDGGLLSAYGIGKAAIEKMAELQVNKALTDCRENLKNWFADLTAKAKRDLEQAGVSFKESVQQENLLFLRFQGQSHTLEIPFNAAINVEEQFKTDYLQLFGHYPDNHTLEVESIKVIVSAGADPMSPGVLPQRKCDTWPSKKITAIHEPQALINVYYWPNLAEGATIKGPAVLVNDASTAFVDNGWELTVSTAKDAIVEKKARRDTENTNLKEAVELELFTNRLTAVAEEMGTQLQRTAFSVNIKERLDFSCAILDADARLLVNAPHIPVHLGSLGVCARLVREKLDLEEGDVVITNHPKYGGSHLPDITLLSAVFHDGERIGYVINRAHHAELGGTRPGSMPPEATTLEEEGVVIPPTYLIKNGKANWEQINLLLSQAKYPTRALMENIADINAALAALQTGIQGLTTTVDVYGLEKVRYYMQLIQNISTQKLRTALEKLESKVYKADESLDDGSVIQVKISIQKERLVFDFSGTSGVHANNLNANPSIVHSAIVYVLRLLCKEDIPLNDGLMEQVKIVMPESFLNPKFEDNPELCPAVVGGNTEVSQRLVDTLLKAFELAACSQGTMNNLLFGNDTFGYYETIGGGVGAGEGFNGRSAVHQHMTNTRITDAEELELRFPVQLRRFEIREKSGGEGQWSGGDGIVREMEFLAPVSVTILGQHRKVAPYGMKGGGPGKTGDQYIERTNGWREYISGSESLEAEKGDRIIIKTPGGGGWGMEIEGETEQ